uniref:Uncharacterized protein n=1 Tax=Xenopus tropicalis TaxID=8364 RepID=A0A6I8QU30_XENTR
MKPYKTVICYKMELSKVPLEWVLNRKCSCPSTQSLIQVSCSLAVGCTVPDICVFADFKEFETARLKDLM